MRLGHVSHESQKMLRLSAMGRANDCTRSLRIPTCRFMAATKSEKAVSTCGGWSETSVAEGGFGGALSATKNLARRFHLKREIRSSKVGQLLSRSEARGVFGVTWEVHFGDSSGG